MMSPNDPTHSASEPHAHHAATVHLSLSEINALCFKAARGAGLGWGEAEEAGWASAWLSRAGLAGPLIVLNWLRDCAALAPPIPEAGRWQAHSAPLCPLRTGLALGDHAGLPEGPGEDILHIGTVAHPLVVLPFVARAAARLDLALRIGWAGSGVVLDTDGLSGVPPEENHTAPADLWITAALQPEHDDRQTDCAVPPKGIALADGKALDAMALRITVPPSPQSRAGAGAAGDDND